MFVGRPAYKREIHDESPSTGKLPVCFVFSYFVDGVRRIFPFDSGAVVAKRFPDSILGDGSFRVRSFARYDRSPHEMIGAFCSDQVQTGYLVAILAPAISFERYMRIECTRLQIYLSTAQSCNVEKQKI